MDRPVAVRVASIGNAMRLFMEYYEAYTASGKTQLPGISNFAIGNPHDMPLLPLVDALQRAAAPQRTDWFAYKLNEPASQKIIAASLTRELGIPFEPADIAMTPGAFGALAIVLQALVDPGDEVILNLPPWFFYEALIVAANGVPVKVAVNPETFDLDLTAIEAAITPRTRAIIVNTPNNPTGRIYPPETLERLATILADASRRNGRRIYLISDEPYRKIVFDGRAFPTPLAFYPYAIMAYSFGKVLLAPGERLGYLALPPTMPDRDQVRAAILTVQLGYGFQFPIASLQHALADLDTMSIDIQVLERKRDRMVAMLREIGYAVHVPEGTFYLLPRSPWEDDAAFIRLLEAHNVLCLPGTIVEFPGFFRISLTASEEMIARSESGFREAFRHACEHASGEATVAVGVTGP